MDKILPREKWDVRSSEKPGEREGNWFFIRNEYFPFFPFLPLSLSLSFFLNSFLEKNPRTKFHRAFSTRFLFPREITPRVIFRSLTFFILWDDEGE